MKSLYLGNVPDDTIARLDPMATADGSSVAVRELAHLSRRVEHSRDNLSAYDATCVALAGALAVPLVTDDPRLVRTPGLGCVTVVVAN